MIGQDTIDASVALYKKTKLENKLKTALTGVASATLTKLEKSLLQGAAVVRLEDINPYLKVILLNHYKSCMNEFKRNIRNRGKHKALNGKSVDDVDGEATEEDDSAIDDAIALALLLWFLMRSQVSSVAISASMASKVDESFEVAERLRIQALGAAHGLSRQFLSIASHAHDIQQLSQSVSGLNHLPILQRELEAIQQDLTVSLNLAKTTQPLGDVFDFSVIQGNIEKLQLAQEQIESTIEVIKTIENSEDLSIMLPAFVAAALSLKTLSKITADIGKRLDENATKASSMNAINDPIVIKTAIQNASKLIENSIAISATLETQIASEKVKHTEAETLSRTTPIKKKWVTVGDDHVRASHAAVNGTARNIDDLFLVGNSLMMFPSDPDHGAELKEIIRCRCSAYYFKE